MSNKLKFDREAGRKLLFDIADTLDELRIPFFLIQGTALGAYRDNGFVPTEVDVDLGVLIEYFDAAAIAASLINKGIEVETWHRHLPFSFCHTIVAYTPGWSHKPGAKADIVGLHKWHDERFTCTPEDPVNVLKPYAIVHDAKLLETYRSVELFGRSFLVPNPIEVYLEREYGSGWRTPRLDHESRTRVYNYLTESGIPDGYFSSKPKPVS